MASRAACAGVLCLLAAALCVGVSASKAPGSAEWLFLPRSGGAPGFRVAPSRPVVATSDMQQLCQSVDGSIAPPFARDGQGTRLLVRDVLAPGAGTPPPRVLCVMAQHVLLDAWAAAAAPPSSLWKQLDMPLGVVDTLTPAEWRAWQTSDDLSVAAAVNALTSLGVDAEPAGDAVRIRTPTAITLSTSDMGERAFLAALVALARQAALPGTTSPTIVALPALDSESKGSGAVQAAALVWRAVLEAIAGSSDRDVVVLTALAAPGTLKPATPRRLADGDDDVVTETYTSSEIEEYQIFIWVCLALAAILVAVVYTLLYMDTRRDPVLYSQFKGSDRPKRD